jgi:hypothetical protein
MVDQSSGDSASPSWAMVDSYSVNYRSVDLPEPADWNQDSAHWDEGLDAT